MMSIFPTKTALLLNISTIFLVNLFAFNLVLGQTYIKDIARDSARSDKRTGGVIEKADLVEGEGDVKLSVNVPAFQMTFWQNGKEVKNYPIGVGMKDHPIFLGVRQIDMIIWNPDWVPPNSSWVSPSLRGKVIKANDSRNPLGKIKIPLGYNYLIHQAKGTGDLGNMVSHGCIRVMRNDLYDLNDKIIAARSLGITTGQIARAKRTKNTLVVKLEKFLPIEITYDTLVVEAGNLRIYPDVYGYDKNTTGNLRSELKSNGINVANISDEILQKMLSRANSKKQYVISLQQIRDGNYLDGTINPVLEETAKPKKRTKRKRRS